MSTKFYTVNICNKTSFNLSRNNHKIKHGTWITWIPEKIKTSSSVSISFVNSRSGHSCKSNLQYGVTLDGFVHVLDIVFVKSSEKDDFSCSFKPFEKQNEVLNNESFKLVNNVPGNICKINTQLIDPNKSTYIESSETIYIINLEETQEGKKYIKSLRNRLDTSILSLKEEKKWVKNEFKGPELVNLYKQASPDFIWNYNHMDWVSTMKKSNTSVSVRIVNLTTKDLRLGSKHSEMYENCILEEGTWVEYPNEEIESFGGTEFGTKSTGFLGGTSGRCVYSILGESGSFTFTWDRASIGPFSAKCNHSLNKYSVTVHTESSNHSVAIFHIIDNFEIPLKILTARAVSPRLVSKYQDTNLGLKYQRHSAILRQNNQNVDNNIEELLITQFLVKHQSSVKKTGSHSELNQLERDKNELFIKSPKHFFSSVNSNNINSPINKVSQDSNIYIEWMIGNEIFSKLFKFDEKIHINTSNISGITENKSTIFNSYLLRLDISSLFEENVENKVNNVINNTEGLNRPYLKTMKQNELLDYVVMIFHCICEGFQPYINRCMTKKLGANWLKICKLPPGHIWKTQDLVKIDLEGIIYIVTAYWMEIFENVLNETTQLNTIQTAAIYWANQELQRFDTNYVWDLLEASKVLLQKLKAESSLKHIEFISNKIVQS